ncbi:cellulase family glycosylhydrolase [Solimonas marina]|uniref:Cellulase family glycosylhydrolase n=1 Tax=Solimonas marina TaxID=2714601 RepID=A0A970B6J8_9GAMM|nr:cellulase family glycosylhydrolase [Solimonas marina]NKF22883.1 cellulase family glycosylhydrolase [Solimonas marina]
MSGKLVQGVAAALCALGLAACGTSADPNASAGNTTAIPMPSLPVSHNGRWLTDGDGRVVIFHGINVAMKEAPYTPQAQGFTEEDAAMLAREGFSTVRVWVFWNAIEPMPGVWDDSSLAALREFVGWLRHYGITTTINFAQVLWGEKFGGLGFPDWAAQTDGLPSTPPLADGVTGLVLQGLLNPALNRAWSHFWANDPYPDNVGLQDHFAQAWAHVAQYFRDVPGIVGYDIVNEPSPGAQGLTCLNPAGCPLFDLNTLTPFNERVVGAIRGVDPDHMIWYEPQVLAAAGFATYVGAGDDPKLALTFHYYPQTGSLGLGTATDTAISLFEADASAHNDALLLSEFGASDDLPTIATLLDAADQARLGWLYWAWYSTEPTGNAQTPTTEVDHPEEGIIIDPMQAPVEDNLKSDKLAVLGRPYPFLVAGTPQSWSFDTSSRTFSLSYSTVPVAGGAPITSPTVIIIPQRLYPQGSYQVSVTGAQVTSAAGAPALTLQTEQAASTVTVTVAPQ